MLTGQRVDVFALIDYDNLPQPIRNAGLVALAWRIEAHVLAAVTGAGDIYIRLYGGVVQLIRANKCRHNSDPRDRN